MRGEVERCRLAVEQALTGRTVSLVCSGDAGVYGMASPALEAAEAYPQLDIEVVPGVTAACSGAALLGAPLSHDFAVISLSDLLTPWPLIEKRLACAAEADFVLCLYNPSSKKRADYLRRACEIVRRFRQAETPAGVVREIGRAGESHALMTLEELQEYRADMFTTVFIGNSQTKIPQRPLGDAARLSNLMEEEAWRHKFCCLQGPARGGGWPNAFPRMGFPSMSVLQPHTARRF